MSDTTEQKLNDADKGVVSELIRELGEDAALVKKLREEAKAVGWKAALTKNLPEIVSEIKDDIAPVKAFIPVAKAGYKTSEFWVVTGVALANFVALLIGKPIPLDVNLVVGTLASIYTIVRGLLKKNAA